MNRLIRGILYITAGCVGIGIAALILGLVLGGGRVDLESDSMYHQAKSAVNAVRDLAINAKRSIASHHSDIEYSEPLDAVDNINGVYDDGEYTHTEYGYDHHLLTVDASDVQKLRIDLRHGSLDINESENHKVRVFMDGSESGILAECSDGELTVKDNRQGNEGRKDVCIYLEIPDSMQFTDVNIQVDAGIVDTECGMRAATLELNADAGEISLCDIQADKLRAVVGAGLIDIENGDFGMIEMECGVGEMDVEASINKDSQISCGMGTVDVELLDREIDDFNYEVSCGMGNIEIGDNDYSGIVKARRIDHGAAATLTLDCGMGEICIE